MTHKVTHESRKLVESASGMGLRHEVISNLVGCSEKTLRKRYRKELSDGIAKAHYNVAKTTYERAMKGDRTMLIWYEKTRMGMRETVQVTTPPGEPLHSVPGEPELIGAYYARLQQQAKGAAGPTLAPDSPDGADPDPDPGVDPEGQGAHRQGRHKAAGRG